MRRPVISFLIAASLPVGCVRPGRHAPAAAPAAEHEQPASAPAQARRPYRPLHKGGGDVAVGCYIREDDDLFLETAMPVVLRRTYLSGDSISSSITP